MAEKLCELKTTSSNGSGSNPLLDLVMDKINASTPSTPSVASNRVSIDTGGYITDGNRVYFYIESTALVKMTKGGTGGVGNFALFTNMPAQYDNPRSWCGYFAANDYQMALTITQQSSSISNIAFSPTSQDVDVEIGDKIITYGFYLKK